MADDEQLFRHPSWQLQLEAIYDNPVIGEWCEGCLLPSALTFKQFIVDTHTLKLYATRHCWTCEECGHYTYSVAWSQLR